MTGHNKANTFLHRASSLSPVSDIFFKNTKNKVKPDYIKDNIGLFIKILEPLWLWREPRQTILLTLDHRNDQQLMKQTIIPSISVSYGNQTRHEIRQSITSGWERATWPICSSERIFCIAFSLRGEQRTMLIVRQCSHLSHSEKMVAMHSSQGHMPQMFYRKVWWRALIFIMPGMNPGES